MKNKLIVLLALSVAVLAACQKNDGSWMNVSPDAEIINGTKVTTRATSAAKSLVLVELLGPTGSQRTFCSATLVGPHTVLTAAHCFDPKHVTNFSSFRVVFANQIGVTDPKWIRRGLVYKQHPNYNSNGRYNQDIGFAIFEGDIPAGFTTSRMDDDVNANYSSNTLYVYGYGRSQDYTGLPGENLRYSVGVLYRGQMQVEENYDAYPDHYLVTKTSPSHICQGDSGGPHFYSHNGVTKIVGVTSANFGRILSNGQHSCSEFSQATKVSPNYSWIKREEQKALAQYYR